MAFKNDTVVPLPWQFLTEGLGKRGIQKKQHRYKNENPLNLKMKAATKINGSTILKCRAQKKVEAIKDLRFNARMPDI